MITILIILYCAIAFIIHHATIKSLNSIELPQNILDNYFMFKCGMFLGAAFWPITMICAIIKTWGRNEYYHF